MRRLTDYADYSIRWFDKDPQRQRLVVAGSSDGDLSVGPSGKHGGASSGEQVIAIVEEGQALRIHGVPTWQDSSTILSYRWELAKKGWRVIRYRLGAADNEIEVLELGAPTGSEDLLPLAY